MSGLPERLRAYVSDDGLWNAALSIEDVREAADAIDRLTSALHRYMAASARLNGNPHDLSNIRKYAEAKGFAEGVLADYKEATHG
jgi:hypothetical protein